MRKLVLAAVVAFGLAALPGAASAGDWDHRHGYHGHHDHHHHRHHPHHRRRYSHYPPVYRIQPYPYYPPVYRIQPYPYPVHRPYYGYYPGNSIHYRSPNLSIGIGF